MAYHLTFENIQVGDLVLVHTWIGSFRANHSYIPCKVIKVGKRTFKLDKYATKTFNKDGNVYGGNLYDQIHVIPYNEETYQRYLKEKEERERKNEILSLIRKTKFESLTIDQLEQVYKAIS